MKFLSLSVFLFAFVSSSFANASYSCFVNSESSALQPQLTMSVNHMQPQALQCSTKKNIGLGLTAIGLSIQAGAFYLACTGIGAPAAIYLEGGALGTGVLSMIVGELPCKDTENEELIKKMAQETVCKTLQDSGIACAFK